MPTDDSDAIWDIVVVGAGAAGLMAAATAAARGRATLLLEKNRKPGVKILMSGGTRCNITQATDNSGIVAQFGKQGRFLHSPLAALGVDETVALFEAEGLRTKIESTGKIFPASDRATDVLAALVRRLERSGATMALDEPLQEIEHAENGFLLRTSKRTLTASRLLITSGGQSYPGCGTTGEGYAWARQFGHTIVPPRPALVPLTTDAPWVRELRGITVPDVARARDAKWRPAGKLVQGPPVSRAARIVSVYALWPLGPGGVGREPRGQRSRKPQVARARVRFLAGDFCC